jgi:hypothetical protein
MPHEAALDDCRLALRRTPRFDAHIQEKATRQACPIPELISVLPQSAGTPTQSSENGRQSTKNALAPPSARVDGTLDECIRRFMQQPETQHHLYEIHTVPQSDLVSAVLSADHVVELARLRDFLGK